MQVFTNKLSKDGRERGTSRNHKQQTVHPLLLLRSSYSPKLCTQGKGQGRGQCHSGSVSGCDHCDVTVHRLDRIPGAAVWLLCLLCGGTGMKHQII